MSQKSRNHYRSPATLCAAFGAVLIIVGGAGIAYAAESDGVTDGNWVRNLYRKFNERTGQPVGTDYRERPPLVVPPTRDLPPPGTPSTLAERYAAWPVDRDEARRKAGGAVRTERRPAAWDSESQPSQASSVEVVGKEEKPKVVTNDPGLGTRLWNKFLGRRDPEEGIFSQEPPRISLVDPPRGYRTPSPAEPYGINNRDTTYTMQRPPLRTGKPENENRE